MYRQDRNPNIGKWDGGLCIYIKYLYKIKEINPLFNVSTCDHETIGIKIKIPHIKPFNVIAIYRPPSGKPKTFLDHLNLLLPDLINSRVENYILGDFNIDYTTKDLLKTCQNTKTIIGWIYSDSPYLTKSGVLNINLSDHLPTYLIRKKHRNKIEKHTITGRSYIRYDKIVFCNLLSQRDWTAFDNSRDVNELWKIFEKHINESLDHMIN